MSSLFDSSSLDQFWANLPQRWPDQADLLWWCEQMGPLSATALVIAGIIYLLFGYYMYRTLFMLNIGLLGAIAGAMIGAKAGSATAGAIVAGLTLGAIAWPLMRWVVAILGGTYGAIIGASAWRSSSLDPDLAWSGALSGLFFFGLLSFIVFRGCVILFTCLQGSVMFILGALALLYKYQNLAPELTRQLTAQPMVLPLAIFIPAIIGLMFQQSKFPAPAPAKK